MNKKEIVGVAPTGFLGYGFSFEDFRRVVEEVKPDFLAVDAGSTDPGPYYLGSGESFITYGAVKKELELIIDIALEYGIPFIIGSAGGSGGRPHLEWTFNIIKELSGEHNWNFPVATIDAEIDKNVLIKWIEEDRIIEFDSQEPLTMEDVKESKRVVAQMGMEPIIKALKSNAKIIICGRAVDDAVFAAYPVMNGYDVGLSTHMGKILECGALAAEPISMDVMIGRIRKDHFILEPGAKHRACTITSVSAHSLYERENPIIQDGPGGSINLENTKVEQISDRKVKVSNTRFVPKDEYYIKLEGVKKIGHRTICIAGVHDPVMIKSIDYILDRLREHAENYIKRMKYEDCHINFHIYGKDGVMGELEPMKNPTNHELGIVIDVVAKDHLESKDICHEISGKLMHLDFTNQYNNAGNLAFLYSPSEINVGDVYTFNIYHLAKIDDPCEPFPINVYYLNKGNIEKEVHL